MHCFIHHLLSQLMRADPKTRANIDILSPYLHRNLQSRKILDVLIVEDNELDSELVVDALLDLKIKGSIKKIFDGATAMRYLKNKNNRRPNLIFLDLHLPKADGFEILAMIEADPRLQSIPIAMTSGTTHYNYLHECYRNLNIVNFVPKPCHKNVMEKTLQKIYSQ